MTAKSISVIYVIDDAMRAATRTAPRGRRIGVARGCTGCTCTLGRRKNRPNLQGEVVSAPPRQSKSPIFLKESGDI